MPKCDGCGRETGFNELTTVLVARNRAKLCPECRARARGQRDLYEKKIRELGRRQDE
jgi:hypothetical protein